MLGGDDDGVHAHGAAVLVVFDSDLRFAVGAQIVHKAGLAHLGQAHGELVRKGDGQGHKLGRLVAGVAEHHALVARAVLKLAVLAGLGLKRAVNAHGDVAGLLVYIDDDAAGVAVKAVLRPVIAYLTHDLARELGDIDIALRAYLAHDVDKAGGGRRLAGDAALGVGGKDGVEHGVGDLVADLIGMPLGDGFGCEKIMTHSSLHNIRGARKTKAPPDRRVENIQRISLIFRFTAGFGTLHTQVAGLHRAVPSTALDKVFNCTHQL